MARLMQLGSAPSASPLVLSGDSCPRWELACGTSGPQRHSHHATVGKAVSSCPPFLAGRPLQFAMLRIDGSSARKRKVRVLGCDLAASAGGGEGMGRPATRSKKGQSHGLGEQPRQWHLAAAQLQGAQGAVEEKMQPGPEPEVLSELEFPLPTFESVVTSYYRIRDGIARTECTRSDAVSKLAGCEVYFKHEYRQATGSFKERGARNAILLLSEEQRQKGIVAASAGNHALGLAYHGRELGIPVTVVMPTTAPLTKVSRCKELGARVVQAGLDIGEAKAYADEHFVEKEGLKYINGFDHPHIVAGQGTIGLEILEQVPDVDAVIVPVGGAGLIAGVALAVKTLKPGVLVLGAEPQRCASFSAALEAGRPVQVAMEGPTLADGLAVPCVGPHAFAVAQRRVDRVVQVGERSIGLAVLRLVELEKVVQEGAGAGALAALLAGHFPELQGKKVVVLLCGANIDVTVLGRVIERGLAADHRLVRFSVMVMDRPGSITALCKVVSDCGASIKDIVHERAWLVNDIAHVQVFMVVETTSREHVEELRVRLEEKISGKSPITAWGTHRLLADVT